MPLASGPVLGVSAPGELSGVHWAVDSFVWTGAGKRTSEQTGTAAHVVRVVHVLVRHIPRHHPMD